MNPRPPTTRRRAASLQLDAVVALGLVSLVVVPLAFGALANQRQLRRSYQRAVALELIDGELEVLASGGWKDAPEGTRAVRMAGNAATNLPPGTFLLTRTATSCRLEWKPADPRREVPVAREVRIAGGAR